MAIIPISTHPTLSATTVKTIDLAAAWPRVEITNRVGTATVYFTLDGTTPVAAADGTYFVLPGQSVIVSTPSADSDGTAVKLIGNGNEISVVGVG